ncbi:MAG: hypothetical protein H7834_12965 [Magnetococcus sp. YQC-9]
MKKPSEALVRGMASETHPWTQSKDFADKLESKQRPIRDKVKQQERMSQLKEHQLSTPLGWEAQH